MAEKKHDEPLPEPARPRLPTAPLEHVYEGVDRLSVPGGYLYLLSGFQPVFVPGA